MILIIIVIIIKKSNMLNLIRYKLFDNQEISVVRKNSSSY